MTDEELICTFMVPDGNTAAEPQTFWWCWAGGKRMLCDLDLDRLHLVEERLSDEQWGTYGLALAESLESKERHFARGLIHATAEAKIRALAQVLRSADRGPGAGEGRE